MAGLLAAAAPASAMPMGVGASQANDGLTAAQMAPRANSSAIGTIEEPMELKAPTNAGTQIGIED